MRNQLLLAIWLPLQVYALPAPVLKTIWVNGAVRAIPDSILQLAVLDDDLLIEWEEAAAPATADVCYIFQLKNFDPYELQTCHPTVRYTRLKGGFYELNIQYEINGERSEALILPIQVQHALTEEWWFFPSLAFYVLLLFSAVIYFILLYKFREKLKIHDVRQRIARDLHDEIGANVSSIGLLIRMVQKKISQLGAADFSAILSDLDKIKSDIAVTVETLRDEDWIIKPENDSLDKLIEKLRSFAYKILIAKEIEFQYENKLDLEKESKIGMIQRRSAFLICKESINNIAKHSEATKAWMHFTKIKEGIKIEIGDNGKGFDPTKLAEGNGLKNFQARAIESLIQLDVQSSPGAGTNITIIIPEI